MCFTIRHGKRLGETLKLPRLSRLSRKSASVLEAATSRLSLGSESLEHITAYPGAEPLVKGSGGETPLKLKHFWLLDVH